MSVGLVSFAFSACYSVLCFIIYALHYLGADVAKYKAQSTKHQAHNTNINHRQHKTNDSLPGYHPGHRPGAD